MLFGVPKISGLKDPPLTTPSKEHLTDVGETSQGAWSSGSACTKSLGLGGLRVLGFRV